MSDNTMTVLVVLLVLVFAGWVIWHSSKAGLFDGKGLNVRAKLCFRMFQNARNRQERMMAAFIALIVLTKSTAKLVLGSVIALCTVVLVGALKYDWAKDVLELAKSIGHYFFGQPLPAPPQGPLLEQPVPPASAPEIIKASR